MKGLFSGRQIRLLASKGDKVTRSQTATNAIKAITAKYGSLKDEEKYFHLGKGNWHKYSLSNDKKRTGKLAQSKEEWRQQPHKLDFQGIDTKVEGSGVKKKTRTAAQRKAKSVKPATPKRVLSMTSLKNNNKLTGRSGKTALKVVGKPVLKTVEKPEIKQKPKELYQTRFIDFLKSTNCRDEFRHYEMQHNQALYYALIHANKIPENVRADYTIEMKGYSIKTLKLNSKAHSEAYTYYLDVQKKYKKFSMGKLKHPFKLTGKKDKPSLSTKYTAALKTIENPKAKPKLNLKSALNKLPAGKRLSGRKEKVKPDKGISFVYSAYKEYPQKATLVGSKIKVTCYENDMPLYKFELPVSQYEKAYKFTTTAAVELLRTKMPNNLQVNIDKTSILHGQRIAIEKVYRDYLETLKNKKTKATVKKKAGTFEHFGKKLTEGKYKEDFANIKNNVMDTLKAKYPDQLFVITARGYYNDAADVYWTGGPSEKDVRKLGLGINRELVDWGDQLRRVYWHPVSEQTMRGILNKLEHNKAFKTKAKAGYTRKLKTSDLEAPKPVVKMPAKIPTKTPAAVPKKTIKGRKAKSQMQIKHAPVLKAGRPKPKVYKGFLVTGDTYPNRHSLNAMGGKWNDDRRGYVIPVTKAKELKAFVKGKKLKISGLKTEDKIFERLTAAERLDKRKEKYEKKAERWENSAARKSKEAAALRESSQKLIENIPFGQPMLIGHHSYNADKNRREKSWNQFGKSIHMQDEADETKRKARVISHVADRLGSTADLQGRIAKTEKELNHARNKVVKAEENKRWAISRKDTEEANRYDAEAKYWIKKAENIQADLDSFKARLPAEAIEKPNYGVTMTMLGGAKLKPLVGASSITKRYHNKNLKGGNFAVEVRKGNKGIELQGYHNVDGIIYSLRLGPLFGLGTPVINQENYKEFRLEQLVTLIKRALEV